MYPVFSKINVFVWLLMFNDILYLQTFEHFEFPESLTGFKVISEAKTEHLKLVLAHLTAFWLHVKYTLYIILA